MGRLAVLFLLLALTLAVMISGCGGGGGGGQTGTASFIVTWPAANVRLISKATQSIEITIANQTKRVTYPATGLTSTINFSGVPVGSQVYHVVAYPTTNGTGTPIGTASGIDLITVDQITPLDITAAVTSTIDHLTVSPDNPSLTVGQNTSLTATAYDADGHIVLTAPGNVSWISSSPSVASVHATSGAVAAVGLGSTTITATEADSGKEDTTVVSVGGIGLLSTVTVGTNPSTAVVNATTNRIYVCNLLSNTISVLDGTTDTVAQTISATGYGLEGGLAVNTNTNCTYVPLSYDWGIHGYVGYVGIISGSATTMPVKIDLGTWYRMGFVGIAVNETTNKIFVVYWKRDSNSAPTGFAEYLAVIDGSTNSVLTTLPMDTLGGIAVNPVTNTVYVSNIADNTVDVIDGTTYAVTQQIPVGSNPEGIAVNSTTNTIYVCNTDSNTVSVINGASNAVITTKSVGNSPMSIAANTAINRLYICNAQGNTVSVLDGSANTIVATVAVGNFPVGIGVNPTTNHVYVSNAGSNTVSVLQGN